MISKTPTATHRRPPPFGLGSLWQCMWARRTTLISDLGRVDISWDLKLSLCVVLAVLTVFGTPF